MADVNRVSDGNEYANITNNIDPFLFFLFQDS